MRDWIALVWTESQVMMNCRPTRSAIAAIVCKKDVLLLSTALAKIEPSAMVTIKSKEFHFESVRLPDTRSQTIVPK